LNGIQQLLGQYASKTPAGNLVNSALRGIAEPNMVVANDGTPVLDIRQVSW
jgi:hypothetical protein